MLDRILEPEVMDDAAEVAAYDAMDHQEVNARFVTDFLAAHGPCRGGTILDVGVGPGRIPIALCQADPKANVLGIDLAAAMIDRARLNVAAAGLSDRIRLEWADAKALPYSDGSFEGVISNTILHHLPDPARAMAEMARLVAPGGTLLCRDLTRPGSAEALDQLVARYAGSEAPAAQAMFAASLHAALALDEVRAIVRSLGLPEDAVVMTSDRHWTWTWRRLG
ncbi:MAG: class I SAM-dependent methyltransferase [Isosphaeraceae bacterium]|nr:class I SAM-dependent methyltransferase [Isosphaeraceae bacterium]